MVYVTYNSREGLLLGLYCTLSASRSCSYRRGRAVDVVAVEADRQSIDLWQSDPCRTDAALGSCCNAVGYRSYLLTGESIFEVVLATKCFFAPAMDVEI